MKNLVFLGVAMAGLATLAVPSVSVTSVSQETSTGVVTVQYSLTEPAVVTVDFTVGVETTTRGPVRSLVGDVNRKITASTGMIRWYPDKDWRGESVDANKLNVKLRAWPLDALPDYMVVDLTVAGDNIRFYESPACFPWDGGVQAFDCKTFKLVFRKIPAAGVVWQMGSPASEPDRVAASETRHPVKLTKDYYMGVYPVTQRQYKYVTEKDPAEYKNGLSPVECTYYNLVRGDDPTYDWPTTGLAVAPTSFMGRLRAMTGGVIDFDLPTEAQWEYACRAGAGTRHNNIGGGVSNADCEKVAWISANAGGRTHPVGLKDPNGWGLYDTLGNVREWCRDWWKENVSSTEVQVDPSGPDAATEFHTTGKGKRVLRGWGWYWNAAYARCARRDDRMGVGDTRNSIGFRVWAPAGFKDISASAGVQTSPETISGLGEFSGQSNDYWNTLTRVDAVVDAGRETSAGDFITGPVAEESTRGALATGDWSAAIGSLALLNLREPTGCYLLFR